MFKFEYVTFFVGIYYLVHTCLQISWICQIFTYIIRGINCSDKKVAKRQKIKYFVSHKNLIPSYQPHFVPSYAAVLLTNYIILVLKIATTIFFFKKTIIKGRHSLTFMSCICHLFCYSSVESFLRAKYIQIYRITLKISKNIVLWQLANVNQSKTLMVITDWIHWII